MWLIFLMVVSLVFGDIKFKDSFLCAGRSASNQRCPSPTTEYDRVILGNHGIRIRYKIIQDQEKSSWNHRTSNFTNPTSYTSCWQLVTSLIHCMRFWRCLWRLSAVEASLGVSSSSKLLENVSQIPCRWCFNPCLSASKRHALSLVLKVSNFAFSDRLGRRKPHRKLFNWVNTGTVLQTI